MSTLHMPIIEKRVAGGQHEKDAMQVDDAFLHPDAGESEHIAHHHDGELNQHHQQGRPGDDPPGALREGVNAISDFGERRQGQPRASVKACSAIRVHSREASSEALKLS